jgi:hypothetical protein
MSDNGKPMDGQPIRKGKKTGDRALEAKMRQARALDMRVAGFQYPDIAEELGYRNKGSAYKAVMAGLKAMMQEPANELRRMEIARLDEAIRVLYPPVLRGSLSHVDRLLKVMERKARMLGLDMPIEHRHSGAGDGGGIEITIKRTITSDPKIAQAVDTVPNGDNGR